MSAHLAPIEVFYSCADTDESLCIELDKHLSLLHDDRLITTWHKRQIVAGQDWTKALDEHLNKASVILLLISPDFLASNSTEIKRAMERYERGVAHVIPIWLRPVDWQSAPFGKLQALPSNGRPVTSWLDHDEAFADVAKGLRTMLQDIQSLAVSTPPTSFPRIWNIPYPPNPVFTGREEILSQIERQLQKGQVTSQPLAISGLGGIGKTQIAVEYAYRHRQDYQAVFWTLTDTRESLISGYITIAKELQLPEKDVKEQQVIIEAVKTWMQTHGSWLLILDNAEDLAIVRDFVPRVFSGHLILTTRARNMGRLAKRIEVEAMSQDMGALLLLRRVGLLEKNASLNAGSPADVATAREICKELGGLPLALDQAGAYIEDIPYSLADYLSLYRACRTEMLNLRGDLIDDHREPVATTWSISFKKVEEKNPAAADLLRFCTFLAPDAIPEEVITRGAEHFESCLQEATRDPLLLNTAIAALGAYSLVRRNVEDKTLSIHRLVQVVLKDTMDGQTRRLWAERAVQIVHEVFPVVSFTTWPQCERYLPHALVCAELVEQEQITGPEAAKLLRNAGNYLIERAHSREGYRLLRQALSMRVGLEHIATVRVDDQVELLYTQVLSIDEEAYGAEHQEVVADLNNLANLYKIQGKYAEAEPLFQRALTIRGQTLGETHPDTAQSMWCLAFTYWHLRQYSKAEPLYKKAFSTFKQEYGLENLNVKKLREDYASLLREMGRNEEADFLETFGHLPS